MGQTKFSVGTVALCRPHALAAALGKSHMLHMR
jgi:hypothetical protein